jgi:hypothetical protein
MKPKKKTTTTRYFLKSGTTVVLIANGYRWDCPRCQGENYTPAVHPAVACPSCLLVFGVIEARHWVGKKALLPGTLPARIFKPPISKFISEEDQASLHEAEGEIVLTASGYAWRCPECDTVNFSPEISFAPARCTCCRSQFEVSEARHRTSFGDIGLRVTPGALWLTQMVETQNQEEDAEEDQLPGDRFRPPPTESFVG